MILGRYTLTIRGLNLNFSQHIIKSGDGPFEVSMAPMIYLGTHAFKDLNTGKITPEGYYRNSYIEESFVS